MNILKRKSRTVIVAGNSDCHSNCRVGLCPPVVHLEQGTWKPDPAIKKYIWDSWLEYWKHVKELKKKHNAKVVAVFNGELCDLNYHRDWSYITMNKKEIKDIALQVLDPAFPVADEFFMVRGTSAHDGKNGWMMEWLAEDVGAVKDEAQGTWSWYWLPLNAAGVQFDISHHPQTASRRLDTRGGGVSRTAKISLVETGEALYSGDTWKPDIIWRGHVHYFSDSGETFPVRVFYTPGWKLTESFGYRLGATGRVEPIGGMIWVCKDGQYTPIPKRYKAKRREPCKV